MGDQQKRWKNFNREGLSYSGNTESELTEKEQFKEQQKETEFVATW